MHIILSGTSRSLHAAPSYPALPVHCLIAAPVVAPQHGRRARAFECLQLIGISLLSLFRAFWLSSSIKRDTRNLYHVGPPPRWPSQPQLTPPCRSTANDSLKAPASDVNNLKSPSTPGVAPSPISSDVGTEFADTEEAVEATEVEPAPARVDTTDRPVQEASSHNSPHDRLRSPNLMVLTPPLNRS